MANGIVLRQQAIPSPIDWIFGRDRQSAHMAIIGLIFAIIEIAAALFSLPAEPQRWRLRVAGVWAITMVLVLAFVGIVGRLRLGRADGIFISDRNLMSLTRFQIVCWTVLIGSGLLALGLARAFHPDVNFSEALDIRIPRQVWELLGISGGSTVLASMVTKNKKTKEPADPNAAASRAAGLLAENPKAIAENRDGLLYRNPSPLDARFMDMLEGDELASTAFLDIGKVQMFLLTVFALLMYGAVLWNLFWGAEASMITEFPGLTQTMVTIIGTSHAAYLGTKWVDQTPVDPAAPPKKELPAGNGADDAGELDG